ncbi:MAG: tetratricopeptide repeat protein [Prochloraceae cyanobacterium]|nr:tetratricopeptide repeat protein [Prochloraceae cyanobacterium]
MINEKQELSLAERLSESIISSLQQSSSLLNEKTVEGALARAKIFGFAGFYTKGIDSLTEALALDHNCHEASARLIIHQILSKRSEAALATATKLASQAPNFILKETTTGESISTFTLLGDALVQNNRIEDAIKAYETAKKVAPNDTTSAAKLAQAYIATGNSTKALEQADIFQDNPRFQDLQAVLRLGNRDEALLPVVDKATLVRQSAAEFL